MIKVVENNGPGDLLINLRDGTQAYVPPGGGVELEVGEDGQFALSPFLRLNPQPDPQPDHVVGGT